MPRRNNHNKKLASQLMYAPPPWLGAFANQGQMMYPPYMHPGPPLSGIKGQTNARRNGGGRHKERGRSQDRRDHSQNRRGQSQDRRSHSHDRRGDKARAALRMATKFGKLNDIPAEITGKKEVLNAVAAKDRIKVHTLQEVEMILSRYITKKGWLGAPETPIASQAEVILNAMKSLAQTDFESVEPFNLPKWVEEHLADFKRSIKLALRAARTYHKRVSGTSQASTLGPSERAAPATNQGPSLTSMRY